jgi:hypothetical protein
MESQCGSRKISGDPSVSVECRVGATPHIANLPAQLTFSLSSGCPPDWPPMKQGWVLKHRIKPSVGGSTGGVCCSRLNAGVSAWTSHTWRSRPATDWRQAASLLSHVHLDGSSVSRCSNQSVDLLLAEANRPSWLAWFGCSNPPP